MADEPAGTAASARIAGYLGVASALAVTLGAGLATLHILQPFRGFFFFQIGLLAGILALITGLVALRATRPSSGRGGRGLAWLGVALGGAAFALLATLIVRALPYPPIHDISTDLQDPPAFVAGPAKGEPPASEDTARKQRAAYPDLVTIDLDVPPDQAMARAERAARTLGWTIVAQDPSAGELEATDTSTIFHFVDDVVVRVRPGPSGGAAVDVRSRSRVGQGDLGANARRIGAFRAELRR